MRKNRINKFFSPLTHHLVKRNTKHELEDNRQRISKSGILVEQKDTVINESALQSISQNLHANPNALVASVVSLVGRGVKIDHL